MNDNIITIGLGFGDEGKGSFTDYLRLKNPDCSVFVKYNGGCQARHSVRIQNTSFIFSQLSSGIFNKGSQIVLSSNFVFNPFNLVNECLEFEKKFGVNRNDILKSVYIDENAICVTSIHKKYNQIEEITKGIRGSTGTGVSIAKLWDIKDGVLYAKDLINPEKVRDVLQAQFDFGLKMCESAGLPTSIFEQFLWKNYIEDIIELIKVYQFNIIDTSAIIKNNKCIYESSQGFLLDRYKGFLPNVTYVDTSLDSLKNVKGKRIGYIRSLYCRHGQGVFPTESKYLNESVSDNSQEVGLYNGKIRFGWFDTVLYRYALKETQVNTVYMSYLDYLKKLENVKICVKYKYLGSKDTLFDELFEYEEEKDSIFIKNIIKSHINIGYYLKNSVPVYESISLMGLSFKEKIDLYLKYIEDLSNVKISVISFGSLVEDKIEV